MNLILKSLEASFSMFWEVLWPLILGFSLSAIVQAVVPHKAMAKTLGKDSPRSLILASLFVTASSSCSYAAAARPGQFFKKVAVSPPPWCLK